ncbi:hypothetical protein [Aeromicrobium sp. Leaf350]|uniref:hypothetical protein n=1 Tax=Aeromicrobium sp. Leaf350 TaxID=2876565 RepID=UPI001E483CDD|nr:hypothetical protein [Aeromicrobium sp. Leaf350]
MNAQKPPRRRRIAGESKPGEPNAPQARRPVPPRTPARPVVPTPKPAPSRKEREAQEVEKTAATATTPTVRRPSRPARPARDERESVTKPDTTPDRKAAEVEKTSSPSLRARVLPVLVLVVGLVAAALGYLQMQRESPLDRADAQAAADAASNGVVAIMSYDYRDLDTYEAEARDVMTEDYVDGEFDDIIGPLREQAEAGQAQVDVTVHAAATETCRGECPAGEASVLVVVDKVTLTANLAEPTVAAQRLRVDMVETDGTWLVDSITYIGA